MTMEQLEQIGSDIDYICEDSIVHYNNEQQLQITQSLLQNNIHGSMAYNRDDYNFGKENLQNYNNNISSLRKIAKNNINSYKENFIKEKNHILNKSLMQYRFSLDKTIELMETSVIFDINLRPSQEEYVIYARKVNDNLYTGGASYKHLFNNKHPKHIKCEFFPRFSRYRVTIEYYYNDLIVTFTNQRFHMFDKVNIYVPPNILN